MQQSSHIGNARRDERVPLSALIELRSEYGDESLAADGLDVSASGLAVRAAFVPEVGTRLYCDFRCPPQDDAVHAVGEVVWAAWDGPRSGSFGMRFLELDTKSATTIRRYVEPGAAPQEVAPPEPPPRVANMRIDGVPTPIEADVRLFEKDCIVLEQELSFLRLGRGIEVDVPGRGKERGRIASIELRQGPLDTPTLVFGVLLDEKPAAQPVRVAVTSTHVQDALEEPFSDLLPQPAQSAGAHSVATPGEDLPSIVVEPAALIAARIEAPVEAAPTSASARPEPSRRPREEPQVVRVAVTPDEARPSEDDDVERLLQNRTPEFVVLLKKLFVVLVTWTRRALLPALRSLFEAPKARAVVASTTATPAPDAATQAAPEAAAEEPLEPTVVVPFSQRVLLPLARARSAGVAFLAKLKKRPAKRRTTSPTPRVQRTQPVRTQRADAPAALPRNRRLLTVSLALVGVGLGVYALAPRSGADRIRVRTREAEPSLGQPVAPASLPAETISVQASSAPSVQPLVPTTSALSVAGSAPVEAAASVDDAPAPSLTTARFGETNVPNGRTFVLRMSGPVTSLEGEKRDDGFSVRIPGRLALDRASPIATSHRAVARALILNRGEYAELTVEFLPGMRPKYQVSGKDNTLEVTLERL